jgi:hypothetical protein
MVAIKERETKHTNKMQEQGNLNNNNSILYYLWAETTAARPITDN